MTLVQFVILLFAKYQGRLNKVNLMKLVLLAQYEMGTRWCEFVPVSRGGYSFALKHACEKLQRDGILIDGGAEWIAEETMAEPNMSLVPLDFRCYFERLDRFGAMSGKHYNPFFIAHVYGIAPEYAIKSVILDELKQVDSTLVARVSAVRERLRKQAESGRSLITIGYEAHTLDSYLKALIRHGITVLVDVRKNSVSRRLGFAKTRLSQACEVVGIRYIHLPNLGIASEKRQSLYTQRDYDILFEEYEATILPKAEYELRSIVELLETGERVALTCFEENAMQCHRTRVAKRIESLYGIAFESI